MCFFPTRFCFTSESAWLNGLIWFDDVCLRSELYHGGPIRTPWQSHQLQDPSCYTSWKKTRRLENRKSNTRLIAKLGNMNTKQWRKEWSQVLFCSFMLAIHCNNSQWLYRGCRAQVVRTFSLYLRPRSSKSLAPQKGNLSPTLTCLCFDACLTFHAWSLRSLEDVLRRHWSYRNLLLDQQAAVFLESASLRGCAKPTSSSLASAFFRIRILRRRAPRNRRHVADVAG